jgi:hypothetical protein
MRSLFFSISFGTRYYIIVSGAYMATVVDETAILSEVVERKWRQIETRVRMHAISQL